MKQNRKYELHQAGVVGENTITILYDILLM